LTIHSIVAKKDGKTRIGKGFSKNELKEAGVDFKQALRMAIPVDLRRKTRHEENVTILRQRLGVQTPKVSKPPEPSKEPVKPVKAKVSRPRTIKVTKPTKQKKTAEAKPSKREKVVEAKEAPKAREVSKAKKPTPKKSATKRKTTKSKSTEKT